MNIVYIVIKKSEPVKIEGYDFKVNFATNEAVFASEKEANEYIEMRKKLNDRDDKNCEFGIEPWTVGII